MEDIKKFVNRPVARSKFASFASFASLCSEGQAVDGTMNLRANNDAGVLIQGQAYCPPRSTKGRGLRLLLSGLWWGVSLPLAFGGEDGPAAAHKPEVLTASPSPSLAPEHVAFLEFLTNRPAIKEIVWELSANRFTRTKPDGTPDPLPVAFVPARGALQPGGFFWEYPTDQPLTKAAIYGESVDMYWWVSTNTVALAPRRGPGAHPQNGMQILGQNYRALLLKLLQLGIEDAAPDSMVWPTPVQFEAMTAREPRVRLVGRLSLDTQGVPMQLEYRAASGPLLECRVDYRYERRGRVLPGSVVHTRRTKDRPVESYTNLIRRLEIGLLPEAAEGFRPSLFVDEQDRHRSLLIFSNAVRYRVTELGMVRDEGVEPPAYALVQTRTGWMSYSLWGLATVSATFLVWRLAGRGKSTSQPRNKT